MNVVVKEWDAEPERVGQVRLSLLIPLSKAEKLPAEGTALDVEITRFRKKRSLQANAYLWKICDDIAKAISDEKENVYRRAIKAVGVFTSLAMRNEAVDLFRDVWSRNGIGFFVEVGALSVSKSYVQAYYGSHLYNTAQMSRLIDWLVEEAAAMGLDVITPAEKSLMMEEWEEAYRENVQKTGIV